MKELSILFVDSVNDSLLNNFKDEEQIKDYFEINKFKVASDNPSILKFTSLQPGISMANDLIISLLSIKFVLFEEHPENSLKILFSIPT